MKYNYTFKPYEASKYVVTYEWIDSMAEANYYFFEDFEEAKTFAENKIYNMPYEWYKELQSTPSGCKSTMRNKTLCCSLHAVEYDEAYDCAEFLEELEYEEFGWSDYFDQA